jgi:uncharacterized protein
MRIIRAVDYRRMPWKNGGGTTTEIAIAPLNATIDTFAWRISMAHVATSGPFSQFPGVDRSLAILEGRGIRLSIDGAPPVTLKRTSAPHFFRGDASAAASLVDGPVDDLNVMSRRAGYRHRMTRYRMDKPIAPPRDADVMAIIPRGDITIAIDAFTTAVGAGDTAIINLADVTSGRPEIDASSAKVDVFIIELRRVA